MSDFSENLAYLRIFKNLVEPESVLDLLLNCKIDDKNDLLSIKQSLKYDISISTQEFVIKKAFNNFINQHIDNEIIRNNHYFMIAKLELLEKSGYHCIDFAACHKNFLNVNQNNIEKIKKSFENIDGYINNRIREIKNFKEIPKTCLMADYTEDKLDSHKIEEDFLEISKRSSFDELDKKDSKKIYRYLSLSLIRKPDVLLSCFSYFYKYNPYFNFEKSSVYEYYIFKFVYHLICYGNFFKYLKKFKKIFSFKILTSDNDIITSDNIALTIDLKRKDIYSSITFLFCNSKNLICFYQKSQDKYFDNEALIILYEWESLRRFSECIFYPSQHTVKQIKCKLLAHKEYFKRYLINSIAPNIIWDMKDDVSFQEAYNSVEKSFLSNEYYIRRLKKWSESVDKTNRVRLKTYYKKKDIVKGFLDWRIEELFHIDDKYEIWRVLNNFDESLMIQYFYNKEDFINQEYLIEVLKHVNTIEFSFDEKWIVYRDILSFNNYDVKNIKKRLN